MTDRPQAAPGLALFTESYSGLTLRIDYWCRRCLTTGQSDDLGSRSAGVSCREHVNEPQVPGKDGSPLRPDVPSGHDHQTIESGPPDYDDVLGKVLGNVCGHTSHVVVGRPLRYCARAAFPGQGAALAREPRKTVALIHPVPPR